MDKIAELLKQIGGSQELTDQIIKEMTDFQAKCETAAEEKFQTRLAKAKEVCLEEVAAEKVALQRKIEIFLEARINTINREAEKQAAIGESEAVTTLRGIKNLVEGVNDDSTPETQAAVAEVKKLRVLVNKLNEEKTGLAAQATRANQIAMKAMQRNKVLESKTQGGSKTEEKPKAFSSVRKESAEPKTTRKTLVESQTHAQTTSQANTNADVDVMAIAERLDESPAYLSQN